MKHIKRRIISIAAVLTISATHAQQYAHGGEYMDAISLTFRGIMEEQMSYTSAVAHGKNARNVEKKRSDLLSTSRAAQKKISQMSGYDGDASLKDSVLAYLELSYIVLNEDYAKIVDMEEIAERSYDDMEAFLLAQEVASQKLESAGTRLDETFKTFAARHNVTLNEGGQDELSKKLELTGETIKHYNTVYLIFFKANKQEAYMIEAMSRNDVSGIEQNRTSLSQTASEGLEKLKPVKSFRGDMSLITNCKLALQFYQNEADVQMKTYTDFLLKKEKVAKMQTALEAKKANERTNEDINAFNKEVAELNKMTTETNKVNDMLNKKRAEVIDKWTKGVEVYMAKHVPKYN